MYFINRSILNIISLMGISASIFVNSQVHEGHLQVRHPRSISVPSFMSDHINNTNNGSQMRNLLSNHFDNLHSLQNDSNVDFERMKRTSYSWSIPRVDNRNRYQDTFRPRARCTKNLQIRNGDRRFRERGSLVQFQCNSGYTLVGASYAICLSNAWSEPIPFCVRSGCRRIVVPLHSFVRTSFGGGVYYFYCDTGYIVKGSDVLTCDGMSWNGTEPTCEAVNTGTTHNYEAWDENPAINSSTLPTMLSPVNTTVLNPNTTTTTTIYNNNEENTTGTINERTTQSLASNNSTALFATTTQNPNSTYTITVPLNRNESQANVFHAADVNKNLNETSTDKSNSTTSTNIPETNASLNHSQLNETIVNATILETTTNKIITTPISITSTKLNTGTTRTVILNATLAVLNATLNPQLNATTSGPLTTATPQTTKTTITTSRAATTMAITLRTPVTSPTSSRATNALPTTVANIPLQPNSNITFVATTVPPTVRTITINTVAALATKVVTRIISNATTTLTPIISTRMTTLQTTVPSTSTTSRTTPIRTTRAPTIVRTTLATNPTPTQTSRTQIFVRTTLATNPTHIRTTRPVPSPTTRSSRYRPSIIIVTRAPRFTTRRTTTRQTTTIAPAKSTINYMKTTLFPPFITQTRSVRTTTPTTPYTRWRKWTTVTPTMRRSTFAPNRNDNNKQDNNVPLVAHPNHSGENKHNNLAASVNQAKLDEEGHSSNTSGGHVLYTIGVIAVIIATISMMSFVGRYCWRKHIGIARARYGDMDGQILSSSSNANDDFNWRDPHDEGL